MYNLIVGLDAAGPPTLHEDRFVTTSEWTEQSIVDQLRRQPDRSLDLAAIETLPTLLMPEVGDSGTEQAAQVGTLRRLRKDGRRIAFSFVPDTDIATIPTQVIAERRDLFAVASGSFELDRTHWAVKNVDLWHALTAALSDFRAAEYRTVEYASGVDARRQFEPQLFKIPDRAPGTGPIAALMPFAHQFTRVYEAMRNAAHSHGLDCLRADSEEMWRNEALVQDIVDLIWDAPFAIVDYTGLNPNVFYEAGIAHTLGKLIVPIGQDSDAPFDVAGNRYLRYHPNEQGFNDLEQQLSTRLGRVAADQRSRLR